MKSAYELAMERLQAEEPENKKLTEAQKAKLAEIDKVYDAKIAEREIFLKQALTDATQKGNFEEIQQIEKQLVHERNRIDEEREEKKDAIREE